MDSSAETLVQNREKRKYLFRQMLDLTEKEAAQLEADEVDNLVATTNEWRVLADEIDALDVAYKEAFDDLSDIVHQAAVDKIAALDEECRQMVQKIAASNSKINMRSQEKMTQYRTEGKVMKKANERLISYVDPYSTSGAIYFDKKR